ncbi:alpha/beta hydrolase [Ureibacillus aquaedulcis]|uniref:Lysophospholipase n=1 Tax=Ureibacillus aquaedulcis TaxID=3058421 RepID=A0ABT8GVX3_9BACL|nr:alpha/beta hydrolase [Ureibacillus sp. BA0131]MDN4495496.1 lysophospholipase [Ureibacillus sp. BA0131]
MVELTDILEMDDGHQIYVRVYKPNGEPRGNFHIMHGMAEHCGRYDDFAKSLAEQGYFVTAHDHRGHGKTAELNGMLGFLGEENGFQRLVDDVFDIIQHYSVDPGNQEIVLFGHSMGSFVARRFLQLYSGMIDKCILCGTGTTTALHQVGNAVARSLSAWRGKNMPSQLMNDLSFNSFSRSVLNPRTIYDWLCSNEEEVEKYIQDPYCGFVPTNQFFVDLTDGLLIINKKEELKNIRKDLPILLISGSEDPVGSKGSGVFKVAKDMNEANLTDVVVYLFEGMRHEILKEVDREHVYSVITRWLNK